MARKRVNSPLKWHGGKHYLAPRIIALMPPHLHYVEPYFGGGHVLFAKDPEGVSEVVNDIDWRLTNFWKCLQCYDCFEQMERGLCVHPVGEAMYRQALRHLAAGCTNPDGHRAHCQPCAEAFFVVARQSMAGRLGGGWGPLSRTRTRRGMNEQASAWLGAVEGLPAVAARLLRVVVLNREAPDVIAQQDGERTCFYLDPPYLPSTRAAPEVYQHEMTEAQHFDLLEQIKCVKGKVLLSGYRSAMYDDRLAMWNRHDFVVPNNAAGGDSKRAMTECVWCNF